MYPWLYCGSIFDGSTCADCALIVHHIMLYGIALSSDESEAPLAGNPLGMLHKSSSGF